MIRWIDNTLGTAAFEDPATAGHEVLDVRGLVDGPANAAAALRERIDAGLALLYRAGKLVVCCDYGISRSNTIASAILSKRDGLPFDEALAFVQKQVGEMRMEYGIVQTVRAALGPVTEVPVTKGRVLVTGGTGFLGQWLQRVAGDRFELIRLGSKELDLVSSPFALDAMVRKLRPETVIHLANPRIYHTHEIVGQALAMLRNVAEVCREHGAHLVYPSGWVIYSGRKNEGDIVVGDDDPPLPYGNYAMSKALSEQMLDCLSRAGSIKACVLRITPIYGEGSTLPRFLFRTAEALRAGQPVTTHCYLNGRPRLQLLHARDAALALALAAEKKAEGRFNIGGTEALTTREIAAVMAEVLGTPFESREIQLQAAVANITLDTTKARDVLGWAPRIGLKQGLAELLLTSPASGDSCLPPGPAANG